MGKQIVSSYPLSPMQQGMLLQSLHERGAYIQQMICDLREEVSEVRLKEAWQEAVQAHEILRTAFRWEGIPEPQQHVYEGVKLPWRAVDLTDLDRQQQEKEFEAFLVSDRLQGFDVTQGPLLSLALLKLGHGHSRLLWTFHHALLDGRSHTLVLTDVF